MNDKKDMKTIIDDMLAKLKAVGILEENNDKTGVKASQRFKLCLKGNIMLLAQNNGFPNYFNDDDRLCMSMLLSIVDWMDGITKSEETIDEMNHSVNLIFLVMTGRPPCIGDW